jgi:hypothetical protein
VDRGGGGDFQDKLEMRSEFISSAVEYSVVDTQMDRSDSEKQLDG